MIILPAIDLKDGQCVRLKKGDYATAHKVAEDAVETAKGFLSAGARLIHMVDLDGAKSGSSVNYDVVRRVIDRTSAAVELGGGIRSMEDLEAVFELGVSRAVIGSAAVSHPELVREAVQRFGEKIAVGIDTQNGRVKTAGWVEDSGLDYLTFAKQVDAMGVKIIIFTDIDTDGALSGPSYSRLEELQNAVSCQIIASGGVSCSEDLVRLHEMGLYGAIVGKAYYTGQVDLAEAVKQC